MGDTGMTEQNETGHNTTIYQNSEVIFADTVEELAEYFADDYPYQCGDDWDIKTAEELDGFEEAKEHLEEYLESRLEETTMQDLICEALQPNGLLKKGGGLRTVKFIALYK